MSDAPSEDTAARLMRRPNASALLLGFTIERIDRETGETHLAWTPKAEFANPMGNVQGGFIAAILDEAASIAGVARSGFTGFVPTLEMKTIFLAPVPMTPLKVIGRVLKFGKSILFLESEILADDGRPLARASQTARFLPRDKAPRK